jgi:hypothetical protein
MQQKKVSRHLRSPYNRSFRFEDVSLTFAVVGVIYTMFICLQPLV